MKRLFVDMDGTLAEFKSVDSLEKLYEKGYFRNLKPQQTVVDAVKAMIQKYPDIEVNILSSVLSDSPHALAEKNAWLDEFLPEIPDAHRIFSPCGAEKTEYVLGGVTQEDFLLDDYTPNLNTWDPPAWGIKLMNGINGTKGSWKGERIGMEAPPLELAEQIVKIMQRKSEQMREEELQKWTIERYDFSEPGYIRFVLKLKEDGTSYQLNGMYRIHDPRNEPDHELVYFDSDGKKHDSIGRNWNEIEKSLSRTVKQMGVRESVATLLKRGKSVGVEQQECINRLFAEKLPEERYDLSGIRFDRVRFTGNMENIDFSHCSFHYCIFQKAKIEQTDFHGAEIEYTDFWDCTVGDSDFRAVSMCGTECHDSQIQNCNFSGAVMISGFVNENSGLSGNNFDQILIEKCCFENVASIQEDIVEETEKKYEANSKRNVKSR